MRPLASLLVLAACISPAPAGSSLVRAPEEDVGLPFWCDWAYDWNERCFRDDTACLPVGGVDDKVWRAALGFSLEGLPARAAITSARLDLFRRRVRGAGSPGRPMSRRRARSMRTRSAARAGQRSARSTSIRSRPPRRGCRRPLPRGARGTFPRSSPTGHPRLAEPRGAARAGQGRGGRRDERALLPVELVTSVTLRPRLSISYVVPVAGLSP